MSTYSIIKIISIAVMLVIGIAVFASNKSKKTQKITESNDSLEQHSQNSELQQRIRGLKMFEYSLLPTYVELLKSDQEQEFRFVDSSIWEKDIESVISPQYIDWDEISCEILGDGETEYIFFYDFPTPISVPLAKYGIIYINKIKQMYNYYTLEKSNSIIETKENELEELKQSVIDMMNGTISMKGEIQTYDVKIENIVSNKNDLLKENEEVEKQIETLKVEKENLLNEKTFKKEEFTKVEKDIKLKQEDNNKLNDDKTKLENDKNEIEKRLKSLTSKVEVMESMDEYAEEMQISKVKHFEIRPMSDEEAVMQLNLIDHDFYMYKDTKDFQVRVVYKKEDGTYGVIAAE